MSSNIDLIRDWVTAQISNNSKEFGTDSGNNTIQQLFINEFYNEFKAVDLPLHCFSNLQTVHRLRNIFLTDNPQYDLRKIHLPKHKKRGA